MQSTTRRTSAGLKSAIRFFCEAFAVEIATQSSSSADTLAPCVLAGHPGKFNARFLRMRGTRSPMSVAVKWPTSGANITLRRPVPELRTVKRDMIGSGNKLALILECVVLEAFEDPAKNHLERNIFVGGRAGQSRCYRHLRQTHKKFIANSYLAFHKTLPVSPFRDRRAVLS